MIHSHNNTSKYFLYYYFKIKKRAFIKNAQKQLDVLGYTEHSVRHCALVAERAAYVLSSLGYSEDRIELARIAGYLHDIGNSVNRVDHAHTGAVLAYNILKDMGMNASDRTEIMMAIGNHDEKSGTAVSDISAALILADKSDAHRTRVSKKDLIVAFWLLYQIHLTFYLWLIVLRQKYF